MIMDKLPGKVVPSMFAKNRIQSVAFCAFLAMCIGPQFSLKNGCVLLAEDTSPIIRLQSSDETTGKFDNSGDLALETPKTTKEPVELKDYPKYTNIALIDFTDSLARLFIKTAGSPEAKISREQYASLCESGKFPISISASEYFEKHDKDRDGQLAISEYIPSRQELISLMDYKKITEAFINGENYPTGEKPSINPVEAPGSVVSAEKQRLFLSGEEIEARIKKYAESIGGSTKLGSDGRLIIFDREGKQVLPPRTLIPPSIGEAVALLEKYAENIGGKIIAEPGKLPIVLGPQGKSIPPLYWPRHLRPPYLKPLENGN